MLTYFRGFNLFLAIFFMVRASNQVTRNDHNALFSLLICFGLCAVYSTNFKYISGMILDTTKSLRELAQIYNDHQAKTNDRLGKVEYICNGDVQLLQHRVSEIEKR